MQDENAQVAQEGINAGKKLLQGLEKNKKELFVVPKSIPITFPMIISFFYFFVINMLFIS